MIPDKPIKIYYSIPETMEILKLSRYKLELIIAVVSVFRNKRFARDTQGQKKIDADKLILIESAVKKLKEI